MRRRIEGEEYEKEEGGADDEEGFDQDEDVDEGQKAKALYKPSLPGAQEID